MRCSCACKSECPDSTLIWVVVSWAGFVLSFPLSFSLSRPGPACLFFPTCSSLQLALALLLCHTCSHFCLITFSLLLVSVSPCSLSDYLVCMWVMAVCYAIYEHLPCLILSCLIKSRGVVLVLCAFVSQSSCCMWPLTRTVFLPYEKLQLSSLSSRQESSFTEEFIFFVFVPVLCHCSTDCLCLFFIKSYYKNLPLHLDPLFHLTGCLGIAKWFLGYSKWSLIRKKNVKYLK